MSGLNYTTSIQVDMENVPNRQVHLQSHTIKPNEMIVPPAVMGILFIVVSERVELVRGFVDSYSPHKSPEFIKKAVVLINLWITNRIEHRWLSNDADIYALIYDYVLGVSKQYKQDFLDTLGQIAEDMDDERETLKEQDYISRMNCIMRWREVIKLIGEDRLIQITKHLPTGEWALINGQRELKLIY
jgi:hypothetical protein